MVQAVNSTVIFVNWTEPTEMNGLLVKYEVWCTKNLNPIYDFKKSVLICFDNNPTGFFYCLFQLPNPCLLLADLQTAGRRLQIVDYSFVPSDFWLEYFPRKALYNFVKKKYSYDDRGAKNRKWRLINV